MNNNIFTGNIVDLYNAETTNKLTNLQQYYYQRTSYYIQRNMFKQARFELSKYLQVNPASSYDKTLFEIISVHERIQQNALNALSQNNILEKLAN